MYVWRMNGKQLPPLVAAIVDDLRAEAHALNRAQADAQRDGHGRPSSPVTVQGALAIADMIEGRALRGMYQ